MDTNIWWIGPFVLVLLRVLYAEAKYSRAQRVEGTLVFQAARGVRMLLTIGIVGFAGGIIASVKREEPWILIAASALVVFFCANWPSTITIGPDGIRRQLWWRATLIIPWSEVSAIEKRKGGDFQVFGKGGDSIVFSRYHVDPNLFEAEVVRRSNLKGTTDASAPPSLHR